MTTTPRVWTRYVALGDSFSEGLSEVDPDRDDHFLGWADRLAVHLARHAANHGQELTYANHAVRGRKLDDVVGPQLEKALAQTPDLVSLVGGGNDILRPRVDLDDIASRLEEAVIALRATGADVLLATPVDTAEAGLMSPLRGRHAVHTANLWTIAGRHGAHVINLWSLHALRDWRMWSADRIHLTAEGHRRVALAALDALGFETDRDDWETRLPPTPMGTRIERAKAHAEWVNAHATPWVGRRLRGRSSGDGREAKRPQLEVVTPDWSARFD